jgi:Flp pilus assembly protein TadG
VRTTQEAAPVVDGKRQARGQALVELGVGLVVVVPLLAVLVDLGVVSIAALELHTAVQAAAMAGAIAIHDGADPQAAAERFAERNRTLAGAATVEVRREEGSVTVTGRIEATPPFGLWASRVPLTRQVTLPTTEPN